MSEVAPYLLDTTVLVDVARLRNPATAWLRERLRSQDRIGVSAVSVAELFAGLTPDVRTNWRRFLGELSYWGVTKEIAIAGGIWRYDLARQGRTLHMPDALIAATAMEIGTTLVTANVKHFSVRHLPILGLAP